METHKHPNNRNITLSTNVPSPATDIHVHVQVLVQKLSTAFHIILFFNCLYSHTGASPR